jgi:hypothetical protein
VVALPTGAQLQSVFFSDTGVRSIQILFSGCGMINANLRTGPLHL